MRDFGLFKRFFLPRFEALLFDLFIVLKRLGWGASHKEPEKHDSSLSNLFISQRQR
jgi:hypothetical protein